MALLISACAAIHFPHPISPVREYDVWVDPNFSNAQSQSIKEAFLEWETNTNETVKFHQVSNAPILGRPLISVWKSNHDLIYKEKSKKDLTPGTTVGITIFHGYDAALLLDDDMGHEIFHRVILHEIGHALNLDHVKDEKYDGQTVMRPLTSQCAPNLTCLDLKLFCHEWRCDAQLMPLCQH